jgi:hypothetical protein
MASIAGAGPRLLGLIRTPLGCDACKSDGCDACTSEPNGDAALDGELLPKEDWMRGLTEGWRGGRDEVLP